MRRPAPRRAGEALAEVIQRAAPATLLARVQSCWAEVAGAAVAAEARPVRERSGTVIFSCRSAAWAQELELLAPELRARLDEALDGAAEGSLEGLRFEVGRRD